MRNGVALAAALALHALLIGGLLRLSALRELSQREAAERRGVLTMIEVPRPDPRPQLPPRSKPLQRATVEPTTSSSTAITLPPALPSASPPALVDWRLEAARSSRQVVDDALKVPPRSLGPPNAPAKENKPAEFEWSPEPGRVGVAGGLPYVRLGKRCVVGLGFFGCAIGDLPEANGRLFDGMRDPDRYESSVPDLPH